LWSTSRLYLRKSGDLSNLLLSEKQLETKGATFYKINRGGDITYHSGQIVGYPILDLENFFNIHKYLRFLEEAIILTQMYGRLRQERGRNWSLVRRRNSICQKNLCDGRSCFRWVTMHGFALNVNADLGYFDNIFRVAFEAKQ
jgi:lipoyl(octanoyl) transferase